jgi:hypothetical protein
MITPVRVVCNNTLNMAFGNCTGRFNLRHTKSIHSKIEINEENIRNATSCLNVLGQYTEKLLEGVERLGNITLNKTKIDHIIKDALASDENRKLLLKHNYDINNDDFSTQFRNRVNLFKSSVYNGVGQNVGPKNSGLWLVNGMTTTFQNAIKANTDKKLTTKFNNLLGGNFYNILNKTNDLVLAA